MNDTVTATSSRDLDTARLRSWLVVGGRHLIDATAPRRDPEPLVLLELPGGTSTPWAGNTVILRWAELGPLQALRTVVPADGLPSGGGAPEFEDVGRVDGRALFDGMRPGELLREALDGAGGPAVPLFVLQERQGPGSPQVHAYDQVRFVAADACFIRVSETAAPDTVTGMRWLEPTLRQCAADALFLNNHQRYYRKCFPGRELEHKYTLEPPTADIWTLTCELMEVVDGGQWPGYVLEYRDEFQAWDYLNHLYQVVEPEEDRGYVSFIPTTDGKSLVKRKWFQQDTFERRESHTYGVELPDGPETYLRDQLQVQVRRLPSFRRVRYDINFESLSSGHVYGIFFDTVTLTAGSSARLQQCELEYLRSRRVLEPDEDVALAELEDLASRLEEFLRGHGLSDERGTYSKLSFLLDTVAAGADMVVPA
jgi:hypothetical protein